MFNKNKFMAALALKGKTLQDVAIFLNKNASTISKKVNGHSEFTRKEIQLLCVFLDLESPVDIFFSEEVA